MAADLVCFRLPPELKLQVENTCLSLGVGMSEWYRALTIAALGGQVGFDDGYRQGRTVALDIARRVIIDTLANLPKTYEEALAILGTNYSDYDSTPRG